MNTILAILPAVISAILGFGISHIICKKITTNSKVQKFLLYVVFISIGVGITGVLNELIAPILIGGTVKTDKVFMFIFSNIIVFPAILCSVIYFLKRSIDKSQVALASDSSNFNVISSGEVEKKIQFSFGGNFFIVVLIAISLGATLILFLTNDFLAKEKRFDVTECEVCDKIGLNPTECKTNNVLKYFVVSESKVVMQSINGNGQIIVKEYPNSEEKCIFKQNGKFSFVCSSYSADAAISEFSLEFDGQGLFKSHSRFSVPVNGEFRLFQETKRACKVT